MTSWEIILRRRAGLILLPVLPLVAWVLVQSMGDDRVYAASARVALATAPAESGAEAAGIVERGRALATSQSVLDEAIAKAGVDRSATEVAKNVTVTGLGSSPIVTLRVTDKDPRVARDLDNALAKTLAEVVDRQSAGDLPAVLKQMDSQLTRLASERDRLLERRIGAVGTAAAVLDAQISTLASQINDVTRRRAQLLDDNVQRSRPTILATAELPPSPEPSTLPQRLALAVLLGLVAGAALAGARETLRPTLAGALPISDALGAPLLGELPTRIETPSGNDLATLAPTLHRIASRRGVQRIAVVSADDVSLQPFVRRLDTALRQLAPGAPPAPVTLSAPTRELVLTSNARPNGLFLAPAASSETSTVRQVVLDLDSARGGNGATANGRYGSSGAMGPIRVLQLNELDGGAAMDTAVLAVVPQVMDRRAADFFRVRLAASDLPMIGVVTYSGRHRARKVREER